jgi:hypothetical protein
MRTLRLAAILGAMGWPSAAGAAPQLAVLRQAAAPPPAANPPAPTLPPSPAPPPAAPSPPPPPPTITLNWVGDIAFSTGFPLPRGGPAAAFAPLRQTLRAADVTIGNLEGTLSIGGVSKCGGGAVARGGDCFAFRAPPGYGRGLQTAGFRLMNVANNHALDFGPTGQRQTISALDAAGLAHTGRPEEIAMLEINGLRVAAIGFAPYPWANSLTDIPAAAALVRRAKRGAGLVVVIMHAGAEGADRLHTPFGTEHAFGEDRGNPRRFAHAVIDAGAAIVLGSGPHVIRGIERYRNRMIAYSLGNFAANHTLGIGGVLSRTAVLRVTLAANGAVEGGRWVSLRLVGAGLPRLDPTHASARLVAELSRADFGTHRFAIHSDGTIDPPGGRALR